MSRGEEEGRRWGRGVLVAGGEGEEEEREEQEGREERVKAQTDIALVAREGAWAEGSRAPPQVSVLSSSLPHTSAP